MDTATTEPGPSPVRRLLRLALDWGGTLLFAIVLFHVVGQLRAPDLPDQAPTFTLQRLDGGTVSLESLRGKTVVLNFWATWCGPCRVEIPSLESFAADHPDIPVLGVATDAGSEGFADKVRDIGIDYTVLLDDGATSKAYGVETLPTTVIISPDGRILDAHSGILTGPQLSWMTRQR